MGPRYVLKMLQKGIVHGSAAQCTNDWKRLRCRFLSHNHTKAGCNLRDELDEYRAAFLDRTVLRNVARGLAHTLGKQSPQGEIAAFRCIIRAGSPA